jgi:hypothetical protein
MKELTKKLIEMSNSIYRSILFKKDLYVYNSDILDIISDIHIVIRIELNK